VALARNPHLRPRIDSLLAGADLTLGPHDEPSALDMRSVVSSSSRGTIISEGLSNRLNGPESELAAEINDDLIASILMRRTADPLPDGSNMHHQWQGEAGDEDGDINTDIIERTTNVKDKRDDESGTWTRRITRDFEFQWTRLNDRNEIDDIRRFDVDRSAYVLKLDYLDDDDKRRKGRCSLVAAKHGAVESWIKSMNGGALISHSDIVDAQKMNFDDKMKWFQETCTKLSEDWGKTGGRICINVRRDFLLHDSIDAVMSMSRSDMRTIWRINSIGESDDGELAKEWFELITTEVFNPDVGLWKMSEANQMCLDINTASGELIICRGHSFAG
jgi:hypothetical protein